MICTYFSIIYITLLMNFIATFFFNLDYINRNVAPRQRLDSKWFNKITNNYILQLRGNTRSAKCEDQTTTGNINLIEKHPPNGNSSIEAEESFPSFSAESPYETSKQKNSHKLLKRTIDLYFFIKRLFLC